MSDLVEYHKKVTAALLERLQWLEKSELPKLKEELRAFHTAFYSLYSILLKKRIINEDPYKQDVKVADIEVPETEPFPEAEKTARMTIRLAQYDNQLDFLVNFCQISVETLTVEKIKRLVGLVKYIDWTRFVMDGASGANTKAAAEMAAQARQGADSLSINIINGALNTLSRSAAAILECLKEASDYRRESYKMKLREKVSALMPPEEAAQIARVKKKFAAAMPGSPFYPDLAEEVIKEDYSEDGEKLRELVLKKLAGPGAAAKTEKAAKVPVSFKSILIEGLFAIGGAGSILADIVPKITWNAEVLENRRKSFWEKFRELLQQMLNTEPEPAVYEVQYTDAVKGEKINEKVNLGNLKAGMEHNIRTLQNISGRGAVLSKLENMEESQLISILEKTIRDIQSLHKTLSALDEFFKTAADKEDRDKVKGIKPELGSLKNAIINANHKRNDYAARKEEEEQFKRLGISPGP
ncbi:MAG: hypothetical protein LBU18_03410 [Treponema sp.]|jgi:hypothetical protein|nr:hypothetical protein [Treponema sp.]